VSEGLKETHDLLQLVQVFALLLNLPQVLLKRGRGEKDECH
jgi:hypothetical protein